jgi:hypothetical protein
VKNPVKQTELLKECLSTQILLGFLYGHYIVSSGTVSLKSMGDTSGGSLVSQKEKNNQLRKIKLGSAALLGLKCGIHISSSG